ncbi:hypothetical protein CspHIS471_0404260 [Cutaneotrichosporon sp. HIS471]|nr:hypothetical protein CspHIS471_0404260 [Cutaneotrichosporon sp. HIS471]
MRKEVRATVTAVVAGGDLYSYTATFDVYPDVNWHTAVCLGAPFKLERERVASDRRVWQLNRTPEKEPVF